MLLDCAYRRRDLLNKMASRRNSEMRVSQRCGAAGKDNRDSFRIQIEMAE